MRKFYSYGPINTKKHFFVPRTQLIEACLNYIVDEPDEAGHYFTIWAPRQTGKTWIMNQVKDEIKKRYSNKFIVGTMSMQGISFSKNNTVDDFLTKVPRLMKKTFKVNISNLNDSVIFIGSWATDITGQNPIRTLYNV